MFISGRGNVLLLMSLGLAGLCWIATAHATSSCQGTYSAALLQPLPAKIVADVDIHDRSPRNLDLAQRFLAGVREAKVAVGPQPNVLLHVNVSRLGGTASEPSRSSPPRYSDFSGLQGGEEVGYPTLPSTGLTARRAPPPASSLYIRVDATIGTATRIAWFASVQCQMTGTDEGQVAQDLGRVIGGGLGKRSESRPF